MSAISYTDDMLTNLSQIMGNTLADVGERYSSFIGSLQSCYDIVNKNRSELAPQAAGGEFAAQEEEAPDIDFDTDDLDDGEEE